MIRANLKPAVISAVVVLILTGLLMGVRLEQTGTGLGITGADADVWWKISAAAAFMFVFNLFRDHLANLWKAAPGLPRVPAKLTQASENPATRRLFWCFLIAARRVSRD